MASEVIDVDDLTDDSDLDVIVTKTRVRQKVRQTGRVRQDVRQDVRQAGGVRHELRQTGASHVQAVSKAPVTESKVASRVIELRKVSGLSERIQASRVINLKNIPSTTQVGNRQRNTPVYRQSPVKTSGNSNSSSDKRISERIGPPQPDNNHKHHCRFCELSFSSAQSLYYHEQRAHEQIKMQKNKGTQRKEPLVCPVCCQRFQEEVLFMAHISTNHSEVPPTTYFCPSCSTIFPSKLGFMRHEKLCCKHNRLLICDLCTCTTIFPTVQDLKTHKDLAHPVNCNQQPINQLRPSKKHTGVYHPCSFCTSSFKSHRALEVHSHACHKVAHPPCNAGIGTQQHRLHFHPCHLCPVEVFASHAKLEMHVATSHSGEKCPPCSATLPITQQYQESDSFLNTIKIKQEVEDEPRTKRRARQEMVVINLDDDSDDNEMGNQSAETVKSSVEIRKPMSQGDSESVKTFKPVSQSSRSTEVFKPITQSSTSTELSKPTTQSNSSTETFKSVPPSGSSAKTAKPESQDVNSVELSTHMAESKAQQAVCSTGTSNVKSCTDVDRGQKSVASRSQHAEKLDKTYHFFCLMCTKLYTSSSGYQDHMSSVHSWKPKHESTATQAPNDFKCILCPNTFSVINRLSQHMRMIHKTKVVQPAKVTDPSTCEKCLQGFVNEAGKRTHQLSCSPNYAAHLYEKGAIRIFECKYCQNIFTKREAIQTHIRLTHDAETDTEEQHPFEEEKEEEREAGVEEKENESEEKENESEEKENESEEKEMEVEEKEKEFEEKEMEVEEEEEQQELPVSSNRNSESDIDINETSNLGDQTSSQQPDNRLHCAECDFVCSDNLGLLEHKNQFHKIRQSSDEEQSKDSLSEDSLGGVPTRTILRQMVRGQTKVSYISNYCAECRYSFAKPQGLQRHNNYFHMGQYSGHVVLQRLDCPLDTCDLYFPNVKELREHVRSAHGKKLLFCDHCITYYSSVSSLANHELLIHDLTCYVRNDTFKKGLHVDSRLHILKFNDEHNSVVLDEFREKDPIMPKTIPPYSTATTMKAIFRQVRLAKLPVQNVCIFKGKPPQKVGDKAAYLYSEMMTSSQPKVLDRSKLSNVKPGESQCQTSVRTHPLLWSTLTSHELNSKTPAGQSRIISSRSSSSNSKSSSIHMSAAESAEEESTREGSRNEADEDSYQGDSESYSSGEEFTPRKYLKSKPYQFQGRCMRITRKPRKIRRRKRSQLPRTLNSSPREVQFLHNEDSDDSVSCGISRSNPKSSSDTEEGQLDKLRLLGFIPQSPLVQQNSNSNNSVNTNTKNKDGELEVDNFSNTRCLSVESGVFPNRDRNKLIVSDASSLSAAAKSSKIDHRTDKDRLWDSLIKGSQHGKPAAITGRSRRSGSDTQSSSKSLTSTNVDINGSSGAAEDLSQKREMKKIENKDTKEINSKAAAETNEKENESVWSSITQTQNVNKGKESVLAQKRTDVVTTQSATSSKGRSTIHSGDTNAEGEGGVIVSDNSSDERQAFEQNAFLYIRDIEACSLSSSDGCDQGTDVKKRKRADNMKIHVSEKVTGANIQSELASVHKLLAQTIEDKSGESDNSRPKYKIFQHSETLRQKRSAEFVSEEPEAKQQKLDKDIQIVSADSNNVRVLQHSEMIMQKRSAGFISREPEAKQQKLDTSIQIVNEYGKDAGEAAVDHDSDLDMTEEEIATLQRWRHCSQIYKFYCNFCLFGTNKAKDMVRHLNNAGTGRYTCKVCGHGWNKVGEMIIHYLLHKEVMIDGKMPCDTCDFTNADMDILKKHMRKHYLYPDAPPDAELQRYAKERVDRISIRQQLSARSTSQPHTVTFDNTEVLMGPYKLVEMSNTEEQEPTSEDEFLKWAASVSEDPQAKRSVQADTPTKNPTHSMHAHTSSQRPVMHAAPEPVDCETVESDGELGLRIEAGSVRHAPEFHTQIPASQVTEGEGEGHVQESCIARTQESVILCEAESDLSQEAATQTSGKAVRHTLTVDSTASSAPDEIVTNSKSHSGSCDMSTAGHHVNMSDTHKSVGRSKSNPCDQQQGDYEGYLIQQNISSDSETDKLQSDPSASLTGTQPSCPVQAEQTPVSSELRNFPDDMFERPSQSDSGSDADHLLQRRLDTLVDGE